MLTTSLPDHHSRPKRATATLALLCLVVLAAILGYQQTAAAQGDHPLDEQAQDQRSAPIEQAAVAAQTAQVAASLGIEAATNPRLYNAISQMEQWSLRASNEVERRQALVVLAKSVTSRFRDQIDGDRRELDFVSRAASSETLTAAVVEMRDQRPVLEDRVQRQADSLEAAEKLRDDEVEQLADDLNRLIEIWSERQRILSDLAIHLEAGRAGIRSQLSDEALAERVLAQMDAAQQLHAAVSSPELWAVEPEPTASARLDSGADALDSSSAELIEGAEMRWPAIGAVNSGFGMRVHPIYRRNIMHTGIDIDAPWGDPVLAVSDGVVTEAHWKGGYGKAVVVDHGDGVTSLYSHLAELAVQPGDVVAIGSELGLVGATGTATDAHLHFEVRVNNEAVNPLDYLP